jgi:hypothetical protein
VTTTKAWRCDECGDVRSEKGELRDDDLCQNILYSELQGFRDCEGQTAEVYVVPVAMTVPLMGERGLLVIPAPEEAP